jgi:hypothetical protein
MCDTRQRILFAECQPLALGKGWRPSALGRPLTALCRDPLCRVFDTRQTSLCRVSSCAECPSLGKDPHCRESSFTECGTRQSLLCRVPDKRHSAKIATLGKALDSGSDAYNNLWSYRLIILELPSIHNLMFWFIEAQYKRLGQESCQLLAWEQYIGIFDILTLKVHG